MTPATTPEAESAGDRPTEARRALEEACAAVGLDGHGARLVRDGENAVFLLRGGAVVARVGRPGADAAGAAREIAVGRWLAGHGFPAVRPVTGVGQPVEVRGLWVTWWEAVRDSGRTVAPERWGEVLRAFHALPPPEGSAGLVLPGYDAFERTARRLGTPAPGVAGADVAFLRDRLAEVRERVAALRFPSFPVPVHGDAHPGNALVEPSGRVVLLDPDGVCLDHPEWDLLPMVTDARRTGWCGPEELRAFLRGYRDAGDGSAPRVADPDWDGWEVLCDLREVHLTTWLMQRVGGGVRDRAAEVELARRVASMRAGPARRDWSPM